MHLDYPPLSTVVRHDPLAVKVLHAAEKPVLCLHTLAVAAKRIDVLAKRAATAIVSCLVQLRGQAPLIRLNCEVLDPATVPSSNGENVLVHVRDKT